jgi:hypothetical protein
MFDFVVSCAFLVFGSHFSSLPLLRPKKVEYFMSRTSRKLLGSLTQDYLWISTLTNQPHAKVIEKLGTSVKSFRSAALTPHQSESSSRTSSMGFPTARGTGSSAPRGEAETQSSVMLKTSGPNTPLYPISARSQEWNKAVNHLSDVAMEQFAESTLLETKKHIFS